MCSMRCPTSQNKEQSGHCVLRRDLAQLEVLRVTRAADQLLRHFAELIEFHRLVQISINESRFGCVSNRWISQFPLELRAASLLVLIASFALMVGDVHDANSA